MSDDAMDAVEVEMAEPEALAASLPPVATDSGVTPPPNPLHEAIKLAMEIAGDPSCVTMPSHRATLVGILEMLRAAL